MNKDIANDKVLFYAGIVLFISVALVAILISKPLIMLAPIAIIAGIILLQKPFLLLSVLVASIPWSIEYSVTSSLSTDLPDEPLMVLLSFAIVILVIYKWKELASKKYYSILLLLLALQIAWLIVSVVFSTNLLYSVKYLLAKGWYLGAFLVAPILLLDDRKKLKRLSMVFLASLTAVVLLSLIRHAGYGMTFSSVNDSLYPFFRNHVNYSALLVCGLPIAIAFYFHSSIKKHKRILVAVILVLLLATYFAYARGAWLAIIAGAFAYYLLRKRMLLQAYIAGVILSIASVLYLVSDDRYLNFAHDYETTIFHENFQEHLIATINLKDVSSAERFHRWIGGIRMIKDYWATGSGPSTFYPLYKQYTVPAFKTWVSRNEEKSTVHNYYLLTVIEQGIVGLILLLLLLGYLFYKAQDMYSKYKDQFWKSTIAVATVIMTIVLTVNVLSDLIEADKIGSMFYLCIAVLVIAELNYRKRSNSTPHIHSIS